MKIAQQKQCAQKDQEQAAEYRTAARNCAIVCHCYLALWDDIALNICSSKSIYLNSPYPNSLRSRYFALKRAAPVEEVAEAEARMAAASAARGRDAPR
jgi:hypothetical protein